MKKVLTAILAVFMITGLLSGCVTNKDSQAAKTDVDEKTLNVYTALEDDQIAEYLKSFKEKYPDVTVNITRDSTGIITAKLLAEKDNPKADVVWGLSAASLLVLEKENMLAPYAPQGVDKILPNFKDAAETPKWVGIDAWETAFVVNKAVLAAHGIKDIPEGYADLIDPKYKGLIAMSNPSSSGTGTLTVNGILSLMGEEKGWQYLDKLHENVNVYLHSGTAPAKNTAKGEYGIGVSFGYRCIKSAKDMGENGVVVFPKEGSGWDVEANCLIKKSGMKEIAKKFLDWAIADEQMKKYATNYPIVATGTGDKIPEGYQQNPVEQLIKQVNLQWCAENRDKILTEWTKRYDGKSGSKS